MEFTQYTKLFIGLVSIVNPIGAIPVFLSMTAAKTTRERTRMGLVAATSVAIILAVTIFLGQPLLNMFGISIPSFRIAGGILILLMALTMLHADPQTDKPVTTGSTGTDESATMAIVPLSMPLLAGPGALSTVIVFAQHDTSWWHYGGMLAVVAGVGLTVGLSLMAAPWLARLIGRIGMQILTRIMGLFLAAIGVEFITNGLGAIFPALKAGL